MRENELIEEHVRCCTISFSELDCQSVSSRGGKKSTSCGKKSTIEVSTPSLPIVGFEMSTSYGARMRGVGMRMIGSGVRIRVNSHPGNSPTKCATNEAESRGLRTINGKVVRSSGREDGSRSRMKYVRKMEMMFLVVAWKSRFYKRLAYEISQVLDRDYVMIKIDGALCYNGSFKEDKAIGKRLRFGSKE
ncbi:hypothetical protein Tco_0455685 [Tanacetum coccineum]